MSVTIHTERPDTADAIQLIQELEAILGPQYPDESRHGYSIEKLIEQGVSSSSLLGGEPAGCGGVRFYTHPNEPRTRE